VGYLVLLLQDVEEGRHQFLFLVIQAWNQPVDLEVLLAVDVQNHPVPFSAEEALRREDVQQHLREVLPDDLKRVEEVVHLHLLLADQGPTEVLLNDGRLVREEVDYVEPLDLLPFLQGRTKRVVEQPCHVGDEDVVNEVTLVAYLLTWVY